MKHLIAIVVVLVFCAVVLGYADERRKSDARWCEMLGGMIVEPSRSCVQPNGAVRVR